MTNNTNKWDPNGIYTLSEIADKHIKPQQINNLKNFSVIGDVPKNGTQLSTDRVLKLEVDGSYNRGVEDFSYTNLYDNLERAFGENSLGLILIKDIPELQNLRIKLFILITSQVSMYSD